MAETGFWATVRRAIRMLCHRRIYVVCMVVIPVAMALFFLSLMSEGLPLKVPTAIVDMDNTGMSRQLTRSLRATELIDIQKKAESYADALNSVKRGETFGFFLIPENFEKDALSGRTPTIDFYTNLTYYVPGTLALKVFRTNPVRT
ncbi:MAG: ABC transporter permease, partial [Muribaculaceae bacterium]|nr:ABC transporter permease [Muribaculaceae bacterium]